MLWNENEGKPIHIRKIAHATNHTEYSKMSKIQISLYIQVRQVKHGLVVGNLVNNKPIPFLPGHEQKSNAHNLHGALSGSNQSSFEKSMLVFSLFALPCPNADEPRLMLCPLCREELLGVSCVPGSQGCPRTGLPGAQGLWWGAPRSRKAASICKHSQGNWNSLSYSPRMPASWTLL